jgi:3'(2'), 5'-bisphosphate nucleotidase
MQLYERPIFSEDIEAACRAAIEAGKKTLEYYHEAYEYEIKGGRFPVTEADLASEETILQELAVFGYGIISEETEDDPSRLDREKVWVIDPLDGTSDFLKKTDEFVVMIGLLNQRQPVGGVVYVPAKDQYYIAEKGKGAYLVDQENNCFHLSVSATSQIGHLRQVTSRSHFIQQEQDIAQEAGITQFTGMGSIGIKLGTIARGDAELYFNTSSGLGEWDLCAPHIILEEAGGFLSDLWGNDLEYNTEQRKMLRGVVAANRKPDQRLYTAFRNILK